MDAETTPPRAVKSSGLTDTKVKALKPEAEAYKAADGGGLYLLVNPGGSKLWRLKYRINGVEKVLAIGAYPEISIKLAREQRDAARRLIAQGMDPMAQRKAEKIADRIAKENSFESIARVWWEAWSSQRSERHAGYVMRRLEADVFPAIGPRPVAEWTAPGLVDKARLSFEHRRECDEHPEVYAGIQGRSSQASGRARLLRARCSSPFGRLSP